MSTDQDSGSKSTRRSSIPRWVIPIYWVVELLLVDVAIPWGIAFLVSRLGWTESRPGVINLYGLVLIATGLVLELWTIALHLVRTSQQVEVERTPTYLLTRGPYQFTRNPMYLGELVLWIGWVFFFGSLPVLIGFLLLAALLNFRVVPREERELEARFGDAYIQYKKRVRRWFGIARSNVQNETT